jgi:hypothetical protein
MPHDKGKGGKKGSGNRYDSDEVAAWMEAKGFSGEVGQPTKNGDEYRAEQLRFLKLKSELHKIKVKTANMEHDEAMGLLVKKSDVEQNNLLKIAAVKGGLLGLPSALSAQLVGLQAPEIESKIESEVMRLLDEFAKR